jgi:TIGR03009 family protein
VVNSSALLTYYRVKTCDETAGRRGLWSLRQISVKSVCSQIETFTTFRAYPLRAIGRGTVCVRIMDDTLLPFRMNIPIMRDSLRSLAAPLALVLVTGTCFDVMAQQAKTTRPAGAQPTNQPPQRQIPPSGKIPVRPASQSIPAERVDPPLAAPEDEISPELETLLKQWESKSALIKILEGKHRRTTYNLVFETEQMASGVFYLETPDKGRIDLVGTKPGKNEKSNRLGKAGHPFRLEEGHGEKWICSGQEVIAVNEEEKSYQIMPLPKDIQGDNIVKSPLPFLFGMKSDEAKQRYRMVLKSNTEKGAVLIIRPRTQLDLQNYSEAWVVLDKSTYLPSAVKLFDPSGNLETVYKFEEIKINKKNTFLGGIGGLFAEKNPFQPDLRRYKLFVAPEETEAPVRAPQGDPRLNVQQPRPGAPAAPRTGQGSAKTNNK